MVVPPPGHCIIGAAMWTFFHKLGSPPWLYAISGAILRWLLPLTIVALLVGVGGDRDRADEVGLLWGTALGLVLAHYYALSLNPPC